MNGTHGHRKAARDCSGQFAGARFNVEDVPRLPPFPARWALEDPRGDHACFVFWTARDGSLAYPLRMTRTDDGEAVRVTKPNGRARRIAIVRRPTPNATGFSILYRCPVCSRPCRYLYPLAASGGTLVDCFGLQCQACAGLRWVSQGRYQKTFERRLLAAVAADYGLPCYREPLPRHPWDPRAVSHPRMVVDEFPNLRERARSNDDHQRKHVAGRSR
jgi:hypothetical protein